MLNRNIISLLLCALLSIVFFIFPEATVSILSRAIQAVISSMSYFFLVTTSLILLLVLIIICSPLGSIRLGKGAPEFSRFSWIAMLFAAGMGSGLVFWGISEPLYHLNSPLNPSHDQDVALAITHFHWGLHAWAIYAISGLAISWFAYQHNRKMSISASFQSTEHKNFFYSFDFLAILAIVFGVAGTLANSIALVETGVNKTISPNLGGLGFRISILIGIAVCFSISSMTGLTKGIKRLSQFNIILALVILVLVIILGSPKAVFEHAFQSTIVYIESLPKFSFTIVDQKWSQGWTIIYLIWWIAWAPFVGLFIARVSYGRSVREFLLSVVFIPTIGSIIWFSAFAGNAFASEHLQTIISSMNVGEANAYTNALFAFLSYLTLDKTLSVLIILLLITFVITSADSAIYVTSYLTENDTNLNKGLWCLVLIAITISLLYKNNVDLNKVVAISGAIPFTLVLIAQSVLVVTDMIKYKRFNR